ncbi:hypothetical protein K7W42_03975 [Deinococcus sp. HMF7604]|uniref:hypothetical protein n=1 Tax=Deinococcus betulae TaxID=2873312 RepID=UPI001CCDAFF2|nr:hypothetical protein [Deinococcus betulae]MBZ9750017.1 hypothetical protein [Deinococcus betulae]
MEELVSLGLFVLLALLVLPVVAFAYARAARRRVRDLAAELDALRERQHQLEAQVRRLGRPGDRAPEAPQAAAVTPVPLPAHETLPPAIPAAPEPPRWPEDDRPQAAPPRPPRGPSVWGPEFSQARISIIGSLLVLGGLAFTLRALGAPAWTLLLLVFTFGGVLYGTARRVPWPVSGALRGLGYGVAALGLGSAAQSVPDTWGPGAVLLGLLLLSGALVWDSLRRREPLLGAVAVGGAALSTWMLTDDLGWASIPAAGAALLLGAVAVWPGRVAGVTDLPVPANPPPGTAHPGARPLTLLATAAVPVGWLEAALSHAEAVTFTGWLQQGLKVEAPLGLWPWLAFTLLALTVPAALRGGPGGTPPRPAERLTAAGATLLPLTLVALAVGTALNGAPVLSATAALGLGLALLPAALAWPGWQARRQARPSEGAEPGLASTLTSSLTAGATSVLGAAALALLGGGAQWTALSGIGAALLALGLAGHSRTWGRVGAGVLAFSALCAAGPSAEVLSGAVDSWPLNELDTALLTAPALVAVLGALRLGGSRWWSAPRPVIPAPRPEVTPLPPLPRLTGPLLGLVGAAAGTLTLAAVGTWPLALWGALAAGAALLLRRTAPGGVALVALTPAAAASGAWLLSQDNGAEVALGVAVTLLAAAAVQGGLARVPTGRAPVWAWAVPALLALTLGRAAALWWPALGVPGGLALATLMSALLPSPLSHRRLDLLLGAGVLAALPWVQADGRPVSAAPVLGGALLLLVWGALRTPVGTVRLGRLGRGRPVDPQGPAEAVLWGAVLLSLLPMLAGAALGTTLMTLGGWWLLGSAAVLAVGLLACWTGHRHPQRTVWDAGLALLLVAGLKAALLDAQLLPNPSPVMGLAALTTGLALLGVAVFAPRPPGTTASVPSAPAAKDGPA